MMHMFRLRNSELVRMIPLVKLLHDMVKLLDDMVKLLHDMVSLTLGYDSHNTDVCLIVSEEVNSILHSSRYWLRDK